MFDIEHTRKQRDMLYRNGDTLSNQSWAPEQLYHFRKYRNDTRDVSLTPKALRIPNWNTTTHLTNITLLISHTYVIWK